MSKLKNYVGHLSDSDRLALDAAQDPSALGLPMDSLEQEVAERERDEWEGLAE